jgi:two-component system, cell cycle response regulator DivK
VKTLLAVDDEPTNLHLIQMAVEESGLDVELITAMNGVEAIERAREARPSLVLMDLKMPGLDGWTATRRLKDDPVTATIPVIALSAQAMAGDHDRALGAGCDGYMSKPLDMAAVIALLRAHLA